jgi:acyl-CoA hydrolase
MVVSAKLLHTGKTSLRAAVEVGVGDPKEGPYAKTTRCVIVFVAPGDGGDARGGGTMGSRNRAKTRCPRAPRREAHGIAQGHRGWEMGPNGVVP